MGGAKLCNNICLFVYVFFCVLFILCVPAFSQAGCKEADADQCNYSTQVVRALVNAPSNLHVSWLETSNVRLGDRVGIAILKLYDEKQMLDPALEPHILSVVKTAFSSPCEISISSDVKPLVTMLLLKELLRSSVDKSDQALIEATMSYIKQQTEAPSCGHR